MAQPTSHLEASTQNLTSQTPVPPSSAQTAQIPLKDFNLPTFPQETLTHPLLNHLILTSDIKLSDYTQLLQQPFSIPSLPSSIASLTLELFALGYPPGFLTELGKNLEGVRNLVVFEQLFAGLEEERLTDAVGFLKGLGELREVHFLDLLSSPGTMAMLAAALNETLQFVEVSYTHRPQNLSPLPGIDEFVPIVKGNLKGLRLGMLAPEQDPESEEQVEMGILPLYKGKGEWKEGEGLAKTILDVGWRKDLILLDLTLFVIPTSSLVALLETSKGLKALSICVRLESSWEKLFGQLKGKVGGVESLEIVGFPGDEDVVEELKKGEGEAFLQSEILEGLGAGLEAVTVSVLRTKGESWRKEEGKWVKV